MLSHVGGISQEGQVLSSHTFSLSTVLHTTEWVHNLNLNTRAMVNPNFCHISDAKSLQNFNIVIVVILSYKYENRLIERSMITQQEIVIHFRQFWQLCRFCQR